MTSRRFGVVPAAGTGSRLRPYRAPKELIQVGYRTVDGRPLPKAAVEHVLGAMGRAGVDSAVLVLSPEKTELLRYLGSGRHLGLDLGYVCQEEPLGLPHALDLAYPFVADGTVCMGMADTVFTPDDCYARLLEFHDRHRADLSLGVFPTENPRALAPVVIEPGTHRVLAIVDKPEHPPAENTWGIAVWSPAFTRLLHDVVGSARPGQGELVLTDVFVAAVAAGLTVRALPFTDGEFFDIGTPEGVLRVRERLETEDAWRS
ncbi:nucleotidyltransferase [Longispora fulva]|uniref:Glucose-1-phosphate thymidylyltransferase n=1 Tax=Longispora fulva TaxID=619741 RepID=A0A8J7KNV6_9ACTN|nr:sugar phosphate nucleotidyltransferase [Longispora fulva]MBG6135612.1 glucose-1-phosphate thymidylyltransferase [Longispora fulva]GIG56149.1 nucleotidyltransferase [Longispora fulva]